MTGLGILRDMLRSSGRLAGSPLDMPEIICSQHRVSVMTENVGMVTDHSQPGASCPDIAVFVYCKIFLPKMFIFSPASNPVFYFIQQKTYVF